METYLGLSGPLPANCMEIGGLTSEVTEFLPVILNSCIIARTKSKNFMSNPVHRLLRFGVYEMNLDTQELRNAGTLVKLSPQPFKLLEMLASHAGQIVTREEIQRQLWGDRTYVDFDRGVHKCINQIRNVLNDNIDRPLYVETLPRKGYRFLAPVTSKTIAALPQIRYSGPVDPGMATQYSKPIPGIHDSAASAAAAAAVQSPISGGGKALSTVEQVGELPAQATTERKQKTSLPFIATLSIKWRSSSRRTRLVWVGVAVVVLVGVAAGGRYLYRRLHPTVITDKDTIVLSDFDNKTGDSVFDGTLRQGLWSALEQSPFLNILSDGRIAQTMALMTQPKGAALTAVLAQEVCVRTGSAATLEGAITKFGTQYVLSLKAVNCRNGDEIAVEQVTAENKEKVVPALGLAASKIRRKLGESLASVEKYDTPLEDVTTPSLEALQAYSRARKEASTNGPVAALPLYKRAVELDPGFAFAYVSLAAEYANQNEPGRASENYRKAYELRAKVSERERLAIEAYYRLGATGELEKAVQVYELWQQAFPREYAPYGNLSAIYMQLGDWEKALTLALGAMRVVPNSNIGYVNAGGAYLALNRLQEAEETFKHAEERGVWSENLVLSRYQLAFLKGDSAAMAQLMVSGSVHEGLESSVLALQADTEGWHGSLMSARNYTDRAVNSAETHDAGEAAAGYQTAAALREVEFGNRQQGKVLATAALQRAQNRDVQSTAAVALARAGDTAQAQNLADALDKAYPLDTLVQKYWLPTIRAALALQRKDPNNAIEALKLTEAVELGQPDPLKVNSFLYPVYLRGEAYLMLHDGKAAEAEFQKFIDHRGVVGNNPMGVLARLGLARAYEEQGDTAKARAAYQDVLTLWKDADPNIPIYQLAKAKHASLN